MGLSMFNQKAVLSSHSSAPTLSFTSVGNRVSGAIFKCCVSGNMNARKVNFMQRKELYIRAVGTQQRDIIE